MSERMIYQFASVMVRFMVEKPKSKRVVGVIVQFDGPKRDEDKLLADASRAIEKHVESNRFYEMVIGIRADAERDAQKERRRKGRRSIAIG